MITENELREMKNSTFETIDTNTVADINDIDIDLSLSREERIRSFLRTGNNPYFVKAGKMLIKMTYASTGRTIDEALQSLVESAVYE